MKATLIKSCFALILTITPLSGFSQDENPGSTNPGNIKFERISRAEGLSNATINFISQDSKGFLWIGTSHGLHKFDAYNMNV